MMITRCSSNDIDGPRHLRRIVGISASLLASAWFPLSTLWQNVYAQSFTEEEIGNYAAAILAVEEIRLDARADISDIMQLANEDITRHDLRCMSTNDLSELKREVRPQVRRLLIKYCNEAKDLVEEQGLTTDLFNAITAAHRQDEALTEQIQLEIAKLQ
ncbi:DUF4168 domain-containing protein [Leptolyngbyaceae cyanobacterium CCMR0082]|nr:DUF4168 domain-containing protein [Adonisia turfae]NEZ65426.1 DUF4168 domain-containing protein [Adonisia turfae CCMR0082]